MVDPVDDLSPQDKEVWWDPVDDLSPQDKQVWWTLLTTYTPTGVTVFKLSYVSLFKNAGLMVVGGCSTS